ncbi:MAG: glycosyltransferase family 4 protein [Chloroflexi bacterium]|nr:glycosyltransferase family 4 protein [Chloroflexota bacterium]
MLTSSIQASHFLQEQFAVPQARIHPLPDCANTTRFDPQKFSSEAKQTLRHQLGIPDGRLIVAYLGLLTDYQGIPHLIETAVRCRDAGEAMHFLVMGYPDATRYQSMADAAGVADTMTFTGKVEYRDAPYYLSLGDIAVAPKMSSTEGSGKVLNYMALGQPIVAYDSAVHREYLADLGVYVPLGDVAGFATAVRQLAHQPERRQELGQQLRQRALQEYSWQRAGRHIIAIYDSLTR